MNICRFCEIDISGDGVKYGVRHYAHFSCYLKSGKTLEALRPWQVGRFPFRILQDFDLIETARKITGAAAQ